MRKVTIKKLCEEIIKAGREVLELNGGLDIRFVLEDRVGKWIDTLPKEDGDEWEDI